MNLNEKIKKVYELKTKQEEIQAKQEELKQQLNELTQEQEKLSDEILVEMKTNNVVEQDTDNLVAQYFSKNEFSYGDEKVLLSKLKELSLDKFIKTVTKTTTSIDKNNLKKELKVNVELKESLKDYVGDRLVEYIVVTTKEKHERMLEHIEENKKNVK